MDIKIQIKEEQPLSDNVTSQNDVEFSTNFRIKTHSSSVLPNAALKTEIENEIAFPDFSSQNGRECFVPHSLKQIKSETVAYSNSCEIDTKIEIASQEEGKFMSGDSVMEVMKYNSDHKMDKNIEIKVEPCCLETETPSVCNYVEDGDFAPVKPPRLCREAASDNNSDDSLSSAEIIGNETSFSYGKYTECEIEKGDATKISHEGKQGVEHHKCETCNKSFKWWSDLNRHILIHAGKKPHKCEICDKSFNSSRYLKNHNLIHEGIKPYKCKICEKSFTQVSNLNSHTLIHEGKKPHKCKYCEKSFTQSSNLKVHILIHEAKKPHKCNYCEKSFTRTTDLKRHIVIHTGAKHYKCEICERSFNNIANLKAHIMIHKGIRPHKCEICEKSFTRVSFLNKHILTHERKKPRV